MQNLTVTNLPSFKGRITPDFIKATNILREFKNQGIISPSFELYRHIKPLRLKKVLATEEYNPFTINFFRDDFSSPDSITKLEKLYEENSSLIKNDKYYSKFYCSLNGRQNAINELRRIMENAFRLKILTYFNSNIKINLLKKLVTNFKIGNCLEQSIIMQDKLMKVGISAHLSKKSLFDHCFVVCNLAKNANISNPSTWGKKAFIVDPWLNKVFRSKEEAFCEYKRIFYNGINILRKWRKTQGDDLFSFFYKPDNVCSYIPMKKNLPVKFRIRNFFNKLIKNKTE